MTYKVKGRDGHTRIYTTESDGTTVYGCITIPKKTIPEWKADDHEVIDLDDHR